MSQKCGNHCLGEIVLVCFSSTLKFRQRANHCSELTVFPTLWSFVSAHVTPLFVCGGGKIAAANHVELTQKRERLSTGRKFCFRFQARCFLLKLKKCTNLQVLRAFRGKFQRGRCGTFKLHLQRQLSWAFYLSQILLTGGFSSEIGGGFLHFLRYFAKLAVCLSAKF